MPNGDSDTVQFKSPHTGAVQALTSDQWEEALSRGYKPVDHTLMYSPEGKRGMVPNAELRDYVHQGYQTTPKTQFEEEHTPEGSALSRYGGAVGDWLKRQVSSAIPRDLSTEGLTDYALSKIPGYGEATEFLDLAGTAKEHGLRRAGEQFLGGQVGLDTERMRARAEHGDTASILGEITVPTAAAVLGGEESVTGGALSKGAGRMGTGAKNLSGRMLRTETGALKPGVRGISRIIGAGLGHMTGIPFMELTGSQALPSLADALLPEHPNPVGWSAKLPARMPRMKAPEGPQAETGALGKIESRGSRASRTESEGRPATWTTERVLELAKQGNRDAIAQAKLRGLKLPENVRYVAGETGVSRMTSPSDVLFDPEGRPIRTRRMGTGY